jgi:hypothetical protein
MPQDDNPPDSSGQPLSQFGGTEQLQAAAAQLAGNTVSVNPGGATFPTIAAALASITDNSLRKQYVINVGPGTFNEQVTLKPYVYLHGAGLDQTTITTPPATQDNAFGRGTVIGASNSGVYHVTLNSLGGSWGDWSTALAIPSCSPFYVGDVMLLCDDQGNAGVNIETCSVNWNLANGQGAALVYFSSVAVVANGRSGDSGTQALAVGPQAVVQFIESKVVGEGAGQSFGGVTASGGQLTLDNCFVQGGTWALLNSDGGSPITANNCQFNGPVSNGVTVNNFPPPQP